MPRKYFSFGLAFKNSFVNYNNISTTYTANELNKLSLDRLDKRKFFEPSFFFKICIPKYSWISLEAISSAVGDVTPEEIPEFEVNPTTFSVGLNFDVVRMYKFFKK